MNLDQAVLKEAVKQGFTIEPGTKHNKVYSPDVNGGQMVTVVSKGSQSPDRGMVYKLIRDLRKGGFVWPPVDSPDALKGVDDVSVATAEAEPPSKPKRREPELAAEVKTMKWIMEQRGDSVEDVSRVSRLPVVALNSWLKGSKPTGRNVTKIDRYNRGVHVITPATTQPLRLVKGARTVQELLTLVERGKAAGATPRELSERAGLSPTQLYPSSFKRTKQVLGKTYDAVLAAVEAVEAVGKPATKKVTKSNREDYYRALGVAGYTEYQNLCLARRGIDRLALHQDLLAKGGRHPVDVAREAGLNSGANVTSLLRYNPEMPQLRLMLLYLGKPMSAYAEGLGANPWPLEALPETPDAPLVDALTEAQEVIDKAFEEYGRPTAYFKTSLPTLEQLIDYVREYKKQGYDILFEIRA